jgi:TonB-linked SusC/RagA family outer membrane protein
MRKFTFLCVILLITGLQGAFAQQKTITGKVTSKEDGTTLPGVTVVVKGTTIGTVTDVYGKYTLTVPAKQDVITFSFVGMKPQDVSIGLQTTIDVVMEADVMNIEGVVITAIGISRETKALGYSVQGVDADQLQKTTNANVLNDLSGKVAGVNVTSASGSAGGASYITIRGASSIGGDNQPLFVVDGVPIDNSQNYSGNPDAGTNNLTEGVAYSNRAIDLNPDDIASVTVLKGGAAAALYGLRAANGVVIITTKKGQVNTGKTNTYSVNFTTSFSIDKVNKLPKVQKKYGQGLNGEWSGPESTNRYSWGPKIDTCTYTNAGLTPDQDVNGDGIYDWDKNGIIVSKNTNPNGADVKPYNNVENFFQTGHTYNNALNISGGNANATYYLSISNLTSSGIVPNNTFNKTTVKIAGETKLSSKFFTSGSVNYIKSGGVRMQQGSNLSGIMLGLLRTPITFDNSNGYDDPVNTPDAYMFTSGPLNGQERSYRGNYLGNAIYDNPYWSVTKNKFKDDVNRMLGSVQITYMPINWLNITYRLGTDFYSDRRKAHYAIHSGQWGAGQVFEDQHYNRDINGDLIINIKKDISKDFKVDFTAGHNMYQTYHQQVYVQGDQLAQVDYYHISNAATITARENQNKKRTAAIYGDLGLSYQSWLFLNITGREEWSTTLSKPFFFPSASLGFVFTEIGSLKENKVLPFGKLRLSYAIIANDAFTYGTLQYFAPGYYADGWTTGVASPFAYNATYMVDDDISNLDLKPEKTKSFEVGTDLRFIKNRINLDIAYYNNVHQDIILWSPLAGSSGYIEKLINAAKMVDKGIEILATFVPIKTPKSKIEWDITINFTKNTNKVLELAPGVENVGLGGFTGADIRAVAGKPYGSIFGTQWVKDGDGKIIINDDPSDPNYGRPIMSSEEAFLGTVQPNWTMGITNSLKLYGFDFSFLIDIKKGGKMWNGTKGIMDALGTSAETENRGESVVMDGVMGHLDADGNLVSTGQANTISTIKDQSWYKNLGGGFGGPTEQNIEKTDWVRLREVNITYTFNPKWFAKSFFKGIEVFVSGRNLLLWTPYTGVDPETSLYGADNAQGIDYFNMPNTRTYTFGLKVQL